MICFLRNYICDEYNTSFDKILKNITDQLNPRNKYYLDVSEILQHTYTSSLTNAYLNYINSVKMLTPSITSGSIEKICNKLIGQEIEYDNICSIQFIKEYEFNFIKDNFVDNNFTPLFTSINIQNIKIVAYTDFSLSTAIENGFNWYLNLQAPKKHFDDEFPIELNGDGITSIENTYKINICIIENDRKKVLQSIKKAATILSEKTIKLAEDISKQFNTTQFAVLVAQAHDGEKKANEANKTTNETEMINLVLESFQIMINLLFDLINPANPLINQANPLYNKIVNLSRKITIIYNIVYNHRNLSLFFSTYNNFYDKTLYIFNNGTNYYTILKDDQVALFNKTNRIFINILIPIESLQKGGTTQKEQIESIMNQSPLNNLLQNPKSENDKTKISKNTLAYIVPIKLEIYEGKDVPLNKKVSLKCEENYNNISKAWKLLFKIPEEKSKPKV